MFSFLVMICTAQMTRCQMLELPPEETYLQCRAQRSLLVQRIPPAWRVVGQGECATPFDLNYPEGSNHMADDVTQPAMVPVESSTISAIGFDAEAQRLWVEFKNGGLYYYHEVADEVHAALMAAESKGKYLLAEIKNKFTFTKPVAS